MTLLFDTFQSTDNTGAASTVMTIPITASTGFNRLALAIFHGAPVLSTANFFVSWGSTATASDSFTEIATGLGNPSLSMLYLLNPDTVAHTVKFEYDDGASGLFAFAAVAMFTGVNQTTPTDVSSIYSTGLGSTSPGVIDTHDVTIANDTGMWVDATMVLAADMTYVADAGQTVFSVTDSYKAAASTVSTMQWTFIDPSTATAEGWGHLSIGLLPGGLEVSLTGTMASTDAEGVIVKASTKIFTGDVSSIAGTIVKASTKVFTGAVSSIVGSLSSIFTGLQGLLVRLFTSPKVTIEADTTPSVNVEADTTPTGRIELDA